MPISNITLALSYNLLSVCQLTLTSLLLLLVVDRPVEGFGAFQGHHLQHWQSRSAAAEAIGTTTVTTRIAATLPRSLFVSTPHLRVGIERCERRGALTSTKSEDDESSKSQSRSQDQQLQEEEEEGLKPLENPLLKQNPNIRSPHSPYNSYQSILSGLDQLYPPSNLSSRNAISRTDGYWTYKKDGKEPPSHLTYGEYDWMFFATLVDRALFHYRHGSDDSSEDSHRMGWEGKVFMDVGSGAGRLVLGAAALHPGWRLCRGLELLPGMHRLALDSLSKCRHDHDNDDDLKGVQGGDSIGNNINDGYDVDESWNKSRSVPIENRRNTKFQLDVGGDDIVSGLDELVLGSDNLEDVEMIQSEKDEIVLAPGVSEGIQALQEMTAEEWKEILGDFVLDQDLMLTSDDDDDDDEEFNECNETNDTGIEVDVDDIASSSENNERISVDNETDLSLETSDEMDQEMERQLKIKRDAKNSDLGHPPFRLPSEEVLINFYEKLMLEKVSADESGIINHYFESWEKLEDMTRDEWLRLYGDDQGGGGDQGDHDDDKATNYKPPYFWMVEQTESQDDDLIDECQPEMNVSSDSDCIQETTTKYYLPQDNPNSALSNHANENDLDHDHDQQHQQYEEKRLPLAPIEFSCGSFEDPYEYMGDVDLTFVFSSCMTQSMMESLSTALGRQLKPGSIIITTEFPLQLSGYIDPPMELDNHNDGDDASSLPFGPYEFELVETVDGWCWLTGGESTAYIHRVKESLWVEGEDGLGLRRVRPVESWEERAWKIVRDMESGALTDTEKFVRDVKNNMAFHGFDWNEEDFRDIHNDDDDYDDDDDDDDQAEE